MLVNILSELQILFSVWQRKQAGDERNIKELSSELITDGVISPRMKSFIEEVEPLCYKHELSLQTGLLFGDAFYILMGTSQNFVAELPAVCDRYRLALTVGIDFGHAFSALVRKFDADKRTEDFCYLKSLGAA